MSSWIDKKYISIFGSSARNFKWKSATLANCSCPLCGDSASNRFKARLFFVERNSRYNIFCHNCGASLSFNNFLKTVNPSLYDEYAKEIFAENLQNKPQEEVKIQPFEVPKFLQSDSVLSSLKRISQLKENHPAKRYVESRKIPHNQHYKLFYAPKFRFWINTIIPKKFPISESDEPRLIIPFLDEDKNVFAVQGRAFGNSTPKYYTIKFDEQKPKIYGLDTVNFDKEYYIVEGPIDSLFLDNCLAMAGSDIQINESFLPNININAVLIYDNEPRSIQIISKMEKVLQKGLKIVIWPENIKFKDINDMVLNGMTVSDIRFFIKSNIYSGLAGLLQLQKWRKI